MNDIMPPDGDDETLIHPDIRSHVRTEAEFVAVVQAGIESAKRGPNRTLDEVAAEIRRSIPSR